MTQNETALPVEDFKPEDDFEGQEARYVLHQGVIAVTVVNQYADASADINVKFTGSNIEWFVEFPTGTTLGPAVGGLSVVLERVSYGVDVGCWYAVAPVPELTDGAPPTT